MKRAWLKTATVLVGLLVTAMYAMPQAYTVSARPGAVNYIEGHAYLNGQPLSDKGLRATFVNANDTLSTDLGRAEVLLTPGVFLRIGDNSRIRMISPSLTNTQIEVDRGEAMVEVDGLLKENNIEVLDHGASITLEKNGLYRFTADDNPTASVIDGKAQVVLSDRRIDLGKGHETLLAANLKEQKFDPKAKDDLYAWSNVRSEYDAASSYQAAKNVTANNYGPWGGLGFGGWYGPGWYWNSAFAGYGWLPGDGAFFSPFGFGFYGAGYLPYAPVIYAPVVGRTTAVPVNPKNPPAVGAGAAASPAINQIARAGVAQSFAGTGGFRTASGAPAASFSSGRVVASGESGSGHSSGGGIHSFSGGTFSASGGSGHAGGGGGHR